MTFDPREKPQFPFSHNLKRLLFIMLSLGTSTNKDCCAVWIMGWNETISLCWQCPISHSNPYLAITHAIFTHLSEGVTARCWVMKGIWVLKAWQTDSFIYWQFGSTVTFSSVQLKIILLGFVLWPTVCFSHYVEPNPVLFCSIYFLNPLGMI